MSPCVCCRLNGMSYAETNGIRLYYAQHGEGDPLVLLHGGIGSGEMFAGAAARS